MVGLAGLFAYNCRHFGDSLAVTIDGEGVSYAGLARVVAAIKRRLGPHLQAGDRVALWLPNSIAWVGSFIAVAELGAVVVPLNTRLTAAEMQPIVEESGARVLLASGAYRGRVLFDEAVAALGGDGPLVIRAGDAESPAEWPQCGRNQTESAEAIPGLLCIQYTSGTTSRPKGVMLTDASYCQTAAYVAAAQMLSPSSQFLSGSPFFHCSGSMHAIAVCLAAGCTLHTMSAWDPELAGVLAERFRCSASHNLFFRDVLALGGDLRRQYTAMRVAAATGTPEMLARVEDEIGIPGISNLYGMTETAGNFTMSHPDDSRDGRLSRNGRPQPGNSVRIVAPESGDVLEPGQEGEIQMHGPTLTQGYFRSPDATRLAFTGDRWLRSGDLGRVEADGTLVYVARLKDVIRTGGENVSPAEVEEAMLDLPGVAEVCVTAAPDERLDEVPAAVVTLQPGAQPDWGDIIANLRRSLAGYKVPKQVHVVDALPKTATNKVQRVLVREQISKGATQRVF